MAESETERIASDGPSSAPTASTLPRATIDLSSISLSDDFLRIYAEHLPFKRTAPVEKDGVLQTDYVLDTSRIYKESMLTARNTLEDAVVAKWASASLTGELPKGTMIAWVREDSDNILQQRVWRRPDSKDITSVSADAGSSPKSPETQPSRRDSSSAAEVATPEALNILDDHASHLFETLGRELNSTRILWTRLERTQNIRVKVIRTKSNTRQSGASPYTIQSVRYSELENDHGGEEQSDGYMKLLEEVKSVVRTRPVVTLADIQKQAGGRDAGDWRN